MIKKRWWNCVQTDNQRCNIKNWKDRSINRAAWEKSIEEGKAYIGL